MYSNLYHFCKTNNIKFEFNTFRKHFEKCINEMNTLSSITFPEGYLTQSVLDVAKKENILLPVINVSRGSSEGDNFSGDIYRVNVTGVKEQGGKASLDIILKSTNISKDGSNREKKCNDNFKKEIDVYKVLFPILESIEKENMIPENERIVIAKFYDGSYKPLKEYIIMEDLSKLGFQLSSNKALDFDHISIIVKSLAKFHALTFAFREKDYRKYTKLTDSYFEFPVNDKFKNYFRRTVELSKAIPLEEEVSKKFKVFTDTILDTYSKYRIPDSTEPYNVICHGDCWFNNFLFKYQNGKPTDVRILDWQLVKIASPVRDLIHLIFICTNDAFRKKHYFETIELYFDNLVANLNILGLDEEKIYPRRVFIEHLKDLAPLGLMQIMIALPFVFNNVGEFPDLNKLNQQGSEYSGINYTSEAKNHLRGAILDCVKFNII